MSDNNNKKVDTIAEVIKVLVKHSDGITRLLSSFTMFSQLIYSLLQKCSSCGIEPATVMHPDTVDKLCDRCVAVRVVSQRRYNDPLISFANEDNWLDLKQAPDIRCLRSAVEILDGKEVIPVTLH